MFVDWRLAMITWFVVNSYRSYLDNKDVFSTITTPQHKLTIL